MRWARRSSSPAGSSTRARTSGCSSAATWRASWWTTGRAGRFSRRSWRRTRPQESLFLLRQSFESLRTIVDSLLKLETVSFRVFHEVGNLALRAILQNQYFRPFRPLEFCIEFDRVKSVPLLDALRRLGDPERRLFTTAFLGLFRLLHYLAYVRPAPRRAWSAAPGWCSRWSAASR